VGDIGDDRRALGEAGGRSHRRHQVRAAAHVDDLAGKLAREDGDACVRGLDAGAQAAQDVADGPVALERVGAKAGHGDRLRPHGPGGQEIGRVRPVALHGAGAGVVGGRLHAEAHLSRRHVGKRLPVDGDPLAVLSCLHGKRHGKIGQGGQGDGDIGPGDGFGSGNFDGHRSVGQGRGQKQTGEILGTVREGDRGDAAGQAFADQIQGRAAGLAEVEHLQAEGRKGIDEFADGAVVQAAMAPDLEDAPAGGGHGG